MLRLRALWSSDYRYQNTVAVVRVLFASFTPSLRPRIVWLVMAMAFILMGTGSAQNPIIFAPMVDYNVAGVVSAVAAGDLNGDGYPDVVVWVSTPNGGALSVSLNNGDGTFGAPFQYPLPLRGGGTILLVDLNNDGYPDIVDVGWSDLAVAVLINYGNGTFKPPILLPTPPIPGTTVNTVSTPYGLASADFDGDGFKDLAFISVQPGGYSPEVTIYHNNGNGTFTQSL